MKKGKGKTRRREPGPLPDHEVEGKALDRNIARLGIKRKYPKNSFLFLARQEARGFFFVVAGEVRVFRMDDTGKEMEIVRLRPGDFFGEAIALLKGKFPAFARSALDTEVLFFETQKIFREMDENPSVARDLVLLLARKCQVLNQRIDTLGLRTVRQRLTQYLLSFCRGEDACRFELPVKKMELARQLGTIPETLSRNLGRLQKDRLIEVRKKTVLIESPRRLREDLRLS
ncbi:MAG: Crp/Fnr family transcriptional regulator [Candidatus Aminicenantes bacterium]|nr:Crp/Fnr family transcriptional regulator [Candidatus Aminicenantes bacterium]